MYIGPTAPSAYIVLDDESYPTVAGERVRGWLDMVLLGLSLGLTLGCAVPVMHPFRTHEGPGGRLGFVGHAGAEKSGGCDNEVGCTPGGAGGFSIVNLDGRWGHKFGENFGLMGGVYFPGFRNSKTGSGYASLVGYGVATVQTPTFSLGAGPEFGSHVVGGAGGVDIQLIPFIPNADLPPGLIALTGYFRYLSPYRIEKKEANGRVPSWDAGGGVRVGPVVLQYTFYRQTLGVIDYEIYETSVRAQSWHMFMLAAEFNRDSLDFDSPSKKARRNLPPPLPRLPPKPIRRRYPGCDRLCDAQASLPCGIPEGECIDACKRRKIAHECWYEDDARLLCQARGVRCRAQQVWFPACPDEQRAFDTCVERR